jgi:hypothetical protein
LEAEPELLVDCLDLEELEGQRLVELDCSELVVLEQPIRVGLVVGPLILAGLEEAEPPN